MCEREVQQLRHDLKNDFGSLKSISKMLGDSRDDFEYTSELLAKLSERIQIANGNVQRAVLMLEDNAQTTTPHGVG